MWHNNRMWHQIEKQRIEATYSYLVGIANQSQQYKDQLLICKLTADVFHQKNIYIKRPAGSIDDPVFAVQHGTHFCRGRNNPNLVPRIRAIGRRRAGFRTCVAIMPFGSTLRAPVDEKILSLLILILMYGSCQRLSPSR